MNSAVLAKKITWLETYFFASYMCGKELSPPECDTRANDSKLRRTADYLIGAD